MSQWAVNGKLPISVWCPSRDDAGNGTTTLNDLVGSNYGTLTNFALTGSTSNWIADTGSSGIRALDFEITNDLVNCGTGLNAVLNAGSKFSVSAWLKVRSVGGGSNGRVFEFGSTNSNWLHSANAMFTLATTGTQFNYSLPSSVALTTGVWIHTVFSLSLGVGFQLYRQGSLVGSASLSTPLLFNFSGNFILGNRENGTRSLDGALDDVRVFNTDLDSSDVSFLYNSGAGRGRLASSRRRNNIFVGALF